MQEKADISNTPEVFYSLSILESLRCMIYTHPDYSALHLQNQQPAQVPSYLHSCDVVEEQKIKDLAENQKKIKIKK
uniref:Uncharacterized protein n=1 Tax=Piliocolobus tephrosceles TaxID=591936 RepID=A0A8C9I990_9PRIM